MEYIKEATAILISASFIGIAVYLSLIVSELKKIAKEGKQNEN